MGEFEQAKPVIEEIKYFNPKIQIVCSFYSPSGLNNQKNYKFADYICYIPFDSTRKAKVFIDTISPDLVIFVRYDLWLNHLLYLKKKNIPMILISADAPKNKAFKIIFKNYLKTIYSLFNTIYTINPQEVEFFKTNTQDTEVIASFDTRFDRIISIVEKSQSNPIINKNKFGDAKILVAGSIWENDFNILEKAIHKLNNIGLSLTTIFVPHEPNMQFINLIKANFPNSVLLSDITNQNYNDSLIGKNIIVDSIGNLLKLYVVADFAFIGGGFGAGVHSITEPAGYGVPLVCGPKIERSPDAIALKNDQLLEIITTDEELYIHLSKLITNENFSKVIGNKCKNYIYSSRGASTTVVEKIFSYL